MMNGLIGQTVGSYRIVEQIGRGGMASVYKAYQPSMERYVALKILPQDYASEPDFVQRFFREARTIAQLEHKSILPVYDFGEDDGVTYLAMRYLESGTLKDVQKMGRLTLADAANITRQMCSALDYAHRQGVVHRDVKPSNIMVDDEGEAYLTDFGIAKLLEGTEQLTASGAFLGTPAYMAPEQVMGHQVDSRTDIYALGIMLYETVVGRVPYNADTPTTEQFVLQVPQDPRAEAQMASSQTADAILALTPSSEPTQKLTPRPTVVPRSTDPPLLADICGTGLCIYNYLTRELISEVSLTQFVPDFSVSWSPDGRLLVLAACYPAEAQDTKEGCGNLFQLDPDSGEVTPILLEEMGESLGASLSPDGLLIAFHHGGQLAVIGVDGLGFRALVPHGPDNEYCPGGVAWSPDSQRLAWLGIKGCGGFPTGVYVIDRDGTGLGKIYDGTVSTPPRNRVIAWNPGGDSVAVTLINGSSILIDSDCYLPPGACGEASMEQIPDIPRHWFDDVYPRWYGEDVLTER